MRLSRVSSPSCLGIFAPGLPSPSFFTFVSRYYPIVSFRKTNSPSPPQRGKKRANTQNSPGTIISTISTTTTTTTASTSNNASNVNALFLTSSAFSEAWLQIKARFHDSDPFVDQTAGLSDSNSSSNTTTTTASSVVDDTDSTKVIPANSNSVTEAGDTDSVRGRGGSNDGHDSRRSPLDSYHMDDDLMGVGGDPYSHPAEFRTESSDEDEGIDEPGPREPSSPEEDRDLDDSIPLNNLTVDEEEEEEEEEEDDEDEDNEDAAGTGAWHEVLVMPSVEMDEMGVYEEDEDDDDEYCADCERERQEQEEEDGDNGYYTVRSFPARRYDEDEDGYYDNGRAGANGSGASGPHNNNNHGMGGYYDDDDDDDDDDFSSHYGGHGGGNTRDNHHGDTSNFTAQYGRSPLLMGEYPHRPHRLPSPSAAATIPNLRNWNNGSAEYFREADVGSFMFDAAILPRYSYTGYHAMAEAVSPSSPPSTSSSSSSSSFSPWSRDPRVRVARARPRWVWRRVTMRRRTAPYDDVRGQGW